MTKSQQIIKAIESCKAKGVSVKDVKIEFGDVSKPDILYVYLVNGTIKEFKIY